MERSVEEVKEALHRIEGFVTTMMGKAAKGESIKIDELLSTMRSMSGNLNDAFDTLLQDSRKRESKIDSMQIDLNRVNGRTVTMIKEMKTMEHLYHEMADRVENLSNTILRNLANIKVKGADESGEGL